MCYELIHCKCRKACIRASVNVTKLISIALFFVNVKDTVPKSTKVNAKIMHSYSENSSFKEVKW